MKNYITELIEQLPPFSNLTEIINNNVKDDNTVQIFVSFCTVCNFSCTYCYAKDIKHQYININQLYSFLIQYHNKYNKNIDLLLVGGEPTLHSDIIEFCKLCSQLDYMQVYIHSNFSADLSIYKDILKYNNVKFILSWHSQNIDFCNKAKDLKAICGYDRFKEQLFIVMYEHENTLLSKIVYKTLEKLDATVDLSLIDVNIRRLDTSYKYTEEQINDAIQFSIKSKEPNILFRYDTGKEIFINEFQYNCLLYFNYIKTFDNWKCKSGNNQLYIHVDGNIYPCTTRYYLKQCAIGNCQMQKIQHIDSIDCCRHCQCPSISKYKLNSMIC